MTDTPVPVTVTTKPTPKAEWSIIGVLLGNAILALLLASFIIFPEWSVIVEKDRIWFLGWALLITVGASPILSLIFLSPNVGSLKIEAFGSEISLNGNKPDTTDTSSH